MSMLNAKFTAETQTTNTKEGSNMSTAKTQTTNIKDDSNMSTAETIKNKQALIQQAVTELQTLEENITAINKSNLNKTIKTQLLAESNKQAKDLHDKAIKLSLEIDTLKKQQAAKEAKEQQLANTKKYLERVKKLEITNYSALIYHTGVIINDCVLTVHPELNSIVKDINNYYILNVETLPANTELSEKCLKTFNNPEIINLGTLLTWLKTQQECLYAQNYSLLKPEYKLALYKVFIELIKPYKDMVTEYYETRKSNSMSSTLDIEFDNRI